MSSIDSHKNFEGFGQECDWFPKEFQRNWARVWLFLFMDSKGLTMHLIDFQKNFWGFSKKIDRFSKGFGKEFICFLKNVVKISFNNSKGFVNEFIWFLKNLVRKLIDFKLNSQGFDNEFNWSPKEF